MKNISKLEFEYTEDVFYVYPRRFMPNNNIQIFFEMWAKFAM